MRVSIKTLTKIVNILCRNYLCNLCQMTTHVTHIRHLKKTKISRFAPMLIILWATIGKIISPMKEDREEDQIQSLHLKLPEFYSEMEIPFLRDKYHDLLIKSSLRPKEFITKTIIILDPGWVVNSFYYLAQFRNEIIQKYSLQLFHSHCKVVIIATQLVSSQFSQNSVYQIVMSNLFNHVSSLIPDKIPELLIDFAVAFFVDRPDTREKQIAHTNALISKYDMIHIPESILKKFPAIIHQTLKEFLGIEELILPNLLNLLSDPIRDVFIEYFRNEDVIKWFPKELQHRKFMITE
eukprot:NODE_240_length_11935_cov_0.818773.p5 type:complete len:294 gc:universal NODE_240_length_11935_cov_0.818773:11694-10813(-)